MCTESFCLKYMGGSTNSTISPFLQIIAGTQVYYRQELEIPEEKLQSTNNIM